MSGVKLDKVIKRYDATQVIHGVDLQIDDGEFCVFVGPSGCGKSTLLRMVAGLEETTEGAIHIGDRDVTKMDPAERGVAMVFQTYALYPHMTVRDNMGFGLKMNGYPKAEIAEKVAAATRILKLEDYLDRKPAALSGGQRQRVSIGRAIVRGPEVFLFDEPLSNLDAALRHHMRVELKRLHRRLKTTIVHVTHDQVEALTLADRILVLNGGVVQQIGSPRELFDTPANIFVAQFIGSPSMNLFPATGAGGEVTLEGVEGALELQGEGRFTLGVRPTDFVLGEGPLVGEVDVVESLGAEALLHILLGPYTVVVQAPEPVGVVSGDRVQLGVGVVHRFDIQEGNRL